jgi:hypothetical protein
MDGTSVMGSILCSLRRSLGALANDGRDACGTRLAAAGRVIGGRVLSRVGVLLLLFLVFAPFPIRAALQPSGNAHIVQTSSADLLRAHPVALRTGGRQGIVQATFQRSLRIWRPVAGVARPSAPDALARWERCFLTWQALTRRRLDAGQQDSTGDPASFGADFRRSA